MFCGDDVRTCRAAGFSLCRTRHEFTAVRQCIIDTSVCHMLIDYVRVLSARTTFWPVHCYSTTKSLTVQLNALPMRGLTL